MLSVNRLGRRFLLAATISVTLLSSVSWGQLPEGEGAAGEAVEQGLAEEHLNEEEAHEAAEEEATWKWANFGLLAIVLGYMMVKFLPPAFADRTKELQKDISEAQSAKAEADRRAADMEARLARIAADIDTFRAGAAVEMKQEGERIRKETAASIQRVEQQSALEIEAAGKTATRELREYSADLALKLAEERLRSKLDAGSSSALVDRFVADLSSRGTQN